MIYGDTVQKEKDLDAMVIMVTDGKTAENALKSLGYIAEKEYADRLAGTVIDFEHNIAEAFHLQMSRLRYNFRNNPEFKNPQLDVDSLVQDVLQELERLAKLDRALFVAFCDVLSYGKQIKNFIEELQNDPSN